MAGEMKTRQQERAMAHHYVEGYVLCATKKWRQRERRRSDGSREILLLIMIEGGGDVLAGRCSQTPKAREEDGAGPASIPT